MKIRTATLLGLIAVVLLMTGYEYGSAEPAAATAGSKFGVVSIRQVFRQCKINAKYRASALAEQSRLKAKEEQLNEEIKALEAGLKALRPGTEDYLSHLKQLLEKRRQLDSMQEFNRQQRILKDQRWTEDLYKEVLQIVRRLAKQKGLTLVLEADEPEFPISSADELMMTLSTHKVLYTGGCVDLTAEVVEELDKRESKFEF